ncbi:MAG TPA: NHLP leader peptide family RiPP precursor [Planctomycetaceae bacterium]|nr:NHLP leader peptide family RiPP precursor [Planctomycetaceae bacterium]
MQTTVQQGSWQKQWGLLVARAWSDESLKERLIADPATVLRENGIEVPYDVELKVVEDTAEVRHLVLPASPSDELSDEELTCSTGFDSFSGICRFSGGDCRNCGCGRCGCGCSPE